MSFSIRSSDSSLAESSWSTTLCISHACVYLKVIDTPSPSCSQAILDVENAATLGFEANFHDGGSKEGWRIVESGRRAEGADRRDNVLGTERVKARIESISKHTDVDLTGFGR